MDCGFLVTENEKPDAMVHFVVRMGDSRQKGLMEWLEEIFLGGDP